MTALLAAQAAAVGHHVFVDVLIAHLGLGVADAQLVEGFVQAEVGHDGGDDGVAQELAPLLHVLAVDVQDVVAGDDVALFVHAQAAVGVAVVGKAHVQPVLYHVALQNLNVGRTRVLVDVVAVGGGIDDVGLGAQGVKNAFCNVPGGTVGAVQANLHALEGIHAQTDEIADVAVSSGNMVNGAADLVALGQRQFLPFPAESLQIAVQIRFHQTDDAFIHLLTEVVDELDAVVVVGVVAGGDHNAAVEALSADDEGHAGGGGDVQQIGVCAGGYQTANKAVLEHIARPAGILADDDSGGAVRAGAALQLGVVPAEKTPDLESVVSGKIAVGFSPEAVGSKIFAHGNGLLSLSDGREMSRKHYFLATIIPPVFQMLLAGTMPRTQEVG